MSASVSVVIIAEKALNYFQRALESVLGQDYSPIEIIIVDNSEGEELPALVAPYDNIQLISLPTQVGLAYILQTSHQSATGDFILWLSEYDILEKNCISESIKAFEQYPKAGCWIAKSYFIDRHSNVLKETQLGPEKEKGMHFLHHYLNEQSRECALSCMVFNRQALMRTHALKTTSPHIEIHMLLHIAITRDILSSKTPLVFHTFQESHVFNHSDIPIYLDGMLYLKRAIKSHRQLPKHIKTWLIGALARFTLSNMMYLYSLKAQSPPRASAKNFFIQFFPYTFLNWRAYATLLGLLPRVSLQQEYILSDHDLKKRTEESQHHYQKRLRENMMLTIIDAASEHETITLWGPDYLVSTGIYFIEQLNKKLSDRKISPITYELESRAPNLDEQSRVLVASCIKKNWLMKPHIHPHYQALLKKRPTLSTQKT